MVGSQIVDHHLPTATATLGCSESQQILLELWAVSLWGVKMPDRTLQMQCRLHTNRPHRLHSKQKSSNWIWCCFQMNEGRRCESSSSLSLHLLSSPMFSSNEHCESEEMGSFPGSRNVPGLCPLQEGRPLQIQGQPWLPTWQTIWSLWSLKTIKKRLFCFLTVDVLWPAASRSRCPDLPTVMDCALEL